MAYKVDFKEVSTIGLETSPVAETLAGLRAGEAKYVKGKFDIDLTTYPASEKPEVLEYINEILLERDLVFTTKALEVAEFVADDTQFAFVYYEDGMGISAGYSFVDPKRRAVGFKLSYGMEIPKEFEGKFKFARQKSKLAIEIRGSYFVIKGEHKLNK